jgi:myosin heavy subunit
MSTYNKLDEMPIQKKSNNTLYLIIVIVILLIFNGVFIFYHFKTDKQLEITEANLVNVEQARDELEKLLKDTRVQLESYKGQNAELDALLEKKNIELEEKAKEIEKLLKRGNVDIRELEKAREELDVLRYYVKKYLNQIDSLNSANKELKQEKQQLQGSLANEKSKTNDLLNQVASLGNKVSLGSRLKPDNLSVKFVKYRGNGKEKETDRANQAEVLKVTFSIAENFVTDKGPKAIYMKVMGPDGGVMKNEDAGSSTFTFEGVETPYSTMQNIDFDNSQQKVTLTFKKGSDFLKGNYKVELYEGGWIMGASVVTLK